MEPLLETIDLDIEESQELLFKVKVEGIDPGRALARLVCEAGDVSYMFEGRAVGDDTVQFMLPVLKDRLKEGVHHSRVEVLIENRYFAPVTFNINFKRAVKVVAEVISRPVQRQVVPQVTVTASAPTVATRPTVPPAAVPVVPKPSTKVVQPSNAPTLRERLERRRAAGTLDDADDSTDLIKQVARSFVQARGTKK